ncbi:MAG: adenylate/guanylate cyclase domain-containing protein [Rhodospirillales bacterium]|nr:adenylate/guanylate cyclase domain-containing protein [Rhodospirillales bacterium]
MIESARIAAATAATAAHPPPVGFAEGAETRAAGLAHNALSDWLLSDGWNLPTLPDLIRGLCARIRAEGIPLCRLRLHVRTLHPQFLGTSYTWKLGLDEIEEFNAAYAIRNEERYLHSPFRAIFEEGVGGVRRRLDVPELVLDFPVLEELRDEGATDYVAMPIAFANGRRSAITFAADRPGGFATGELEVVEGMLPVLARLVEVHALRRTARTILETYLGRSSGARVLDGLIRRGDGDDINAVIWFCDLRASTALADILPRQAFLCLLNGFFEATAGAVLAHGGEVLRFIGDAFLAIFPLDPEGANSAADGGAEVRACARALAAARDALARMDAYNAERQAVGEPPLRFGIGLHIGDVTYGNIGVEQRLEFTVIGPAANEAARLEGVCKTLDRRLVISAELARWVREPLISLGFHALRGVREPQEVLTLADL